MQEPDLPTRESLRFILPLLTAESRLLEVGCGDGKIAGELRRLGFSVLALDRAPAAVHAARARGVEAIEVDFFDLKAPRFDVILFTRSLHHIYPLEAALDHASNLLRSPGLIIADEFAWDRMDIATARWFYDLRGILEASSTIAPETTAMRDSALQRWLNYHEHTPPLTSGETMLRGAEKRFEIIRQAPAPYLYRYFHHWLATQPCADPVASEVLAMETHLIASSTLIPVGLQFVARQ